MTALLHSGLFPESDPSELASIVAELGYDGVDLDVRGLPSTESERTLALLAAEESPALMLSLDSAELGQVAAWAELAAAAGCAALRLPPYEGDGSCPAADLPQLVESAERSGVRLLVPNHAGCPCSALEALASALAGVDPARVAVLLAPDQIPRSRAGDHAAWIARLRLPPIGAVCLGGYRWDSQVGAGNIRLWTPVPTLVSQSLTPWPAWLQRLRASGFDGLFTCGDPTLPASAAERLRLARDDRRYLRRVWA
jgi:sugar phosphate isomerase/epimerase